MKSSPGEWGFLALSFSCSFHSPLSSEVRGHIQPTKGMSSKFMVETQKTEPPSALVSLELDSVFNCSFSVLTQPQDGLLQSGTLYRTSWKES